MTWLGDNVIETASGRHYDYLQPDPDEIVLEDIAHALANACRFAGHTRRFYSVAEHSVLVADIVEAWVTTTQGPRLGFTDLNDGNHLIDAALMHDAHEAYVWDAPRPIKPLLGEAFALLAGNADEAIGTALGINPDWFHHSLIKDADDVALFHEGRELMTVGPAVTPVPLPPSICFWAGLSPEKARSLFLQRASERGFV